MKYFSCQCYTFLGQFGGFDNRHAGVWNASSSVIRLGYHDGPVTLFNLTERGEGDTLILSPLSHFMDTSLTQVNRTSHSALEYGVVGSMTTVPGNYIQSFIVFYSSSGVNKATREWGQTLQRVFNRTNEYRSNDLSLNYLGYYIDNGGYYCYNTLPGMNYQDTMIEIAEQIDISYHYMEISAWFYYKGVAGGVSNWSACPDVFPIYIVDWEIFLSSSTIDIGPTMPFIKMNMLGYSMQCQGCHYQLRMIPFGLIC